MAACWSRLTTLSMAGAAALSLSPPATRSAVMFRRGPGFFVGELLLMEDRSSFLVADRGAGDVLCALRGLLSKNPRLNPLDCLSGRPCCPIATVSSGLPSPQLFLSERYSLCCS